MYIQPNSDIYIFHGIPLDNTYTDTIYFESLEAQTAFFMSNRYNNIHFFGQSYQRENRNYCRLNILADDILDYNYMAFRNTSYGSKWFYAFITQINYVNDHMTEVEYEIDVMQTWLFETTLDPCMVVREHTANDAIGAHLAPEPVDIGRIICDSVFETPYFDSYVAVIAMASQATSARESGILLSNENIERMLNETMEGGDE